MNDSEKLDRILERLDVLESEVQHVKAKVDRSDALIDKLYTPEGRISKGFIAQQVSTPANLFIMVVAYVTAVVCFAAVGIIWYQDLDFGTRGSILVGVGVFGLIYGISLTLSFRTARRSAQEEDKASKFSSQAQNS